MAADPAKRAAFIQSSADLLLKYNFDGLDFDWEYPANRGGSPADKVVTNDFSHISDTSMKLNSKINLSWWITQENYITLITEMKAAFAPHGLMLSAATSVGTATIESGYDLAAMSRYIHTFNHLFISFKYCLLIWNNCSTTHNYSIFDQIHVMAYDIHGTFEPYTGHNAPLYANPTIESGDRLQLNVVSIHHNQNTRTGIYKSLFLYLFLFF